MADPLQKLLQDGLNVIKRSWSRYPGDSTVTTTGAIDHVYKDDRPAGHLSILPQSPAYYCALQLLDEAAVELYGDHLQQLPHIWAPAGLDSAVRICELDPGDDVKCKARVMAVYKRALEMVD